MLGLSAGATVVEPFEASMKTLPSGTALATEAAAISPLAPARFSTTTERFSRSAMPGATMRANKSLGPPGGKPNEAQRPVGKIRRLGAGGQAGGQNRQGRKSGECGTAAEEEGHRRLW